MFCRNQLFKKSHSNIPNSRVKSTVNIFLFQINLLISRYQHCSPLKQQNITLQPNAARKKVLVYNNKKFITPIKCLSLPLEQGGQNRPCGVEMSSSMVFLILLRTADRITSSFALIHETVEA